jgi:hypothetical protein
MQHAWFYGFSGCRCRLWLRCRVEMMQLSRRGNKTPQACNVQCVHRALCTAHVRMQLSHAEMELYVERAAVVAALGEQLLRAAANVRETFVSRRARRAPCALSAGMCGLAAAAANRPMRLRRAALSLTVPGNRVPGSTRQYPAVPSSTRQYQSTALICPARRLSPLGAVDYCCAYCRALQCVPWVNSGSVGSGRAARAVGERQADTRAAAAGGGGAPLQHSLPWVRVVHLNCFCVHSPPSIIAPTG